MAATPEKNLGNPNPTTSAQVIHEIEQHYFRPGLKSSEYAALRDHTHYLDVVHYAKLKSVNPSPIEMLSLMETVDIAKRRNKAGVYGKNAEKLIEIGSFNQRLLVAYTAEDVPHAELINKATVVFHRISDRLENPPVQPALQK